MTDRIVETQEDDEYRVITMGPGGPLVHAFPLFTNMSWLLPDDPIAFFKEHYPYGVIQRRKRITQITEWEEAT